MDLGLRVKGWGFEVGSLGLEFLTVLDLRLGDVGLRLQGEGEGGWV